MELWQLRTFCEIAETLNFTKASEKLNLTQSAVSHQIKALEEELGVQLFHRAKRGVVLSAAGKAALVHAKAVLDEADALREVLAGKSGRLTGMVRVAAATQALVHLFAPIFEDFMDAHPEVELIFRTTTSTEQTVDDVLNGIADVGFASMAVYSPVLDVSELFEDELWLVVGKKHLYAKRKFVEPTELRKEKWILFERGSSIRRSTDDLFERIKVEPEKALESNDTYFVKLMIEHGLGLSLMPAWTVVDEVRNGKLSILRVKGHKLRRKVSIISKKGIRSAPISEFVEFTISKKKVLQSAAMSGAVSDGKKGG